MSVAVLRDAEPTRLEKLANAANHEHDLCFKAAMSMLYHGIAAGEALIEAKSLIPRGQWMRWLAENVTFSQTTAASFMLVARHKDHLLSCQDVTTMQTALERLRRDKLTTQTRIDDDRITEIRQRAREVGTNAAARELGESYGTVQRYASGAQKVRRVKPPSSGTQPKVTSGEITHKMIERLAVWMGQRLCHPPAEVNAQLRQLAHEALQAVFHP